MEIFLRQLGLERLTEQQIKVLPPPVLAYVGDAVYELYVRLWTAGVEQGAVTKHHRRTVRYVKASAQAKILQSLTEMLTEEEADVVFLLDRPYLSTKDPTQKDLAYVDIAKNRNGAPGEIEMEWVGSRAWFRQKKQGV